jgi:hypothetical protein
MNDLIMDAKCDPKLDDFNPRSPVVRNTKHHRHCIHILSRLVAAHDMFFSRENSDRKIEAAHARAQGQIFTQARHETVPV